MSPRARLSLTPRPLERVESGVAVAGFFSDERPLRGGVARADWRLCGGLSKRVESGDLSGKSGEALLIACGRALRSPRLLVLGLGDRSDYDALRVADETGEALRRCVGLRCGKIVLSPLGVAPDDIPRHAPALVAGIRDALASSDSKGSSASGSGPDAPDTAAKADLGEPGWEVQLCVPRSEIPGVYRALEQACKAARAEEIELIAPPPERTLR